MYHAILVPLDGSKRAEAILPHLEELARRYEAKVIFLQIIEPVLLLGGPEIVDMRQYEAAFEEQTKQAEVYLNALKVDFSKKGIEARTLTAQGPVVEAITNVSQRENVDLIAIASHGRSGISRVFYGSVAAGVLHRVDRPLLLIRSD
jgi:nucleotide-binding universal stress UspA family protein